MTTASESANANPDAASQARLKALVILKNYLRNPLIQGAPNKAITPAVQAEFNFICGKTRSEPDFPKSLLNYYNMVSGPGEPKLTEEEAVKLADLFGIKRGQGNETISTKPQRTQTEREIYTSAFNPTQPGQAGPPQQDLYSRYSGQAGDDFRHVSEDLRSYDSLMEWTIRRFYGIPSGAIKPFMDLFRLRMDHYLTHPEDLKHLMRGHFGSAEGENAFNYFMAEAPRRVTGQMGAYGMPSNPYGYQAQPDLGLGNVISALGIGPKTGLPLVPGAGGEAQNELQKQILLDYLEDRREERREKRRERENQGIQDLLTRKFQSDLSTMFGSANLGGQQANTMYNPSTGERIIRRFDNVGNVVEEQVIKPQNTGSSMMGAGGFGGDPSAMGAFGTMAAKFIEVIQKDKEMLMNSNYKPAELMIDLIKSTRNNQDPIDAYRRMKEILPDNSGGDNFDKKIALLHEEFGIKAQMHEWDEAREERQKQSETEDKYFSLVDKYGSELMTPLITDIAKGVKEAIVGRIRGQRAVAAGQGMMQQGMGPQQGQEQQIYVDEATGQEYTEEQAQLLARRRAAEIQHARMQGRAPPSYGQGGYQQQPQSQPQRPQRPAGLDEQQVMVEEELQDIVQQKIQINNAAQQINTAAATLQQREQELHNQAAAIANAQAFAEQRLRQANEKERAVQQQEEQLLTNSQILRERQKQVQQQEQGTEHVHTHEAQHIHEHQPVPRQQPIPPTAAATGNNNNAITNSVGFASSAAAAPPTPASAPAAYPPQQQQQEEEEEFDLSTLPPEQLNALEQQVMADMTIPDTERDRRLQLVLEAKEKQNQARAAAVTTVEEHVIPQPQQLEPIHHEQPTALPQTDDEAAGETEADIDEDEDYEDEDEDEEEQGEAVSTGHGTEMANRPDEGSNREVRGSTANTQSSHEFDDGEDEYPEDVAEKAPATTTEDKKPKGTTRRKNIVT